MAIKDKTGGRLALALNGYAFQCFAISLLVPVMLAFYATGKYRQRLRQS